MADVLPIRIPAHPPTTQPERLWRELLGRRLRIERLRRRETLTQTAARAGISPQYLSEVERGIKEPSSEMIAAIAGALETRLLDLAADVVHDLRALDAGRATVISLTSSVQSSTQRMHEVSSSTMHADAPVLALVA